MYSNVAEFFFKDIDFSYKTKSGLRIIIPLISKVINIHVLITLIGILLLQKKGEYLFLIFLIFVIVLSLEFYINL